MLVLASASPRRQELLRNAGIEFTVQPADIDESPLQEERSRECAERLAREKALAVWKTRPQDVVLGADTIVVVGETILNKPVNAVDAARMLRLLSGRTHEVITGVCVVSPVAGLNSTTRERGKNAQSEIRFQQLRTENSELRIASESTLVTMNSIPEDEIQEYIATGEPMDKAGAYAIQGRASRWIPRIEGDYPNVVGLPIALVYRMLSGTQSEPEISARVKRKI
jgi:septum formation protein